MLLQFYFFSIQLLSVLRGHSVFSSLPLRSMTSDFEGFSIPDFIHYIYFPILILDKEAVFPCSMWVLNKGTTGTNFVTSLVWRGPWLEIEPGTSRTRSQHYWGGSVTTLNLCVSLSFAWVLKWNYTQPRHYQCEFKNHLPLQYCISIRTSKTLLGVTVTEDSINLMMFLWPLRVLWKHTERKHHFNHHHPTYDTITDILSILHSFVSLCLLIKSCSIMTHS